MPFLPFLLIFGHFLVIFWTPLVYSCFSLFWTCQVFPWKMENFTENPGKSLKISKNSTFPKNVTDKPDTPEKSKIHHFSWKKRQFCQKPLGLDRGWKLFCQSVLPWCPVVVSWVKKWHFVKKPLDLDRVLTKIHCFWWKSLFLMKITVLVENH